MTPPLPPSGSMATSVNSRHRYRILSSIYAFWILSLPFYQFSVVGTYSIDNLLAPLVCILAVPINLLQDRRYVLKRMRILLLVLTFYSIYGLARMITFYGIPKLFLIFGQYSLLHGFYFLAPILFIHDLRTFRMTKSMLIIVTMTGAMSAFLAAIGLIHLGLERFDETRVGLAWLPKAIGLFSSYGDLAILYGFTVVLIISHGRKDLFLGLGTRFGKMFVWITLLLGLVGSQSRNILLSTLTALGIYWVFRKFQKPMKSNLIPKIGLLLAGIIISSCILIVYGDNLMEIISNLGGKRARLSVDDRIGSYALALQLLKEEPMTFVLGVSSENYLVYAPVVDHIHNMWLKLLLTGGIFAVSGIAGLLWIALYPGLAPAKKPIIPAEPPHVVSTVAAIFIASQFYGGLSQMMWVLLGMLISFSGVMFQGINGGNNEK